jgi:hypothetical protein
MTTFASHRSRSMTIASSPRSLVLALVPMLAIAACAGHRPGTEGTRLETQVVRVDEPPTPAGGPVAEQAIPEESAGEDLANAVAHMVANDGQPRDGAMLRAAPCFSRFSAVPAEPLEERGVYRSLDPFASARSWVFVGLALGSDGVSPALYAGPCGGLWMESATSRLGRLAPEVAGRDTSLLFTRKRATLANQPRVTDLLGAVVDRHAGDRTGDTGRTAKPRPAEGTTSAAPATPAPAQPAAAPAEPAKDSRKGGLFRGVGGGDRRH